MKRLLSIVLVLALSLGVGCAAAADQQNGMVIGLLQDACDYKAMAQAFSGAQERSGDQRVYYSNLSTMLMGLRSRDVDCIGVTTSTAQYVVARNEDLILMNNLQGVQMNNYSMMTMQDNQEAYSILDNAIIEMKNDGTLDRLIQDQLSAHIASDPEPASLPEYPGAATIRVAITGDLPPMDYVSADGVPAGFNVALLSEIANRAQVNIEMVPVESGARAIALASGRVDAIFWTVSITDVVQDVTWYEQVEGAIPTESYFSDWAELVQLK